MHSMIVQSSLMHRPCTCLLAITTVLSDMSSVWREISHALLGMLTGTVKVQLAVMPACTVNRLSCIVSYERTPFCQTPRSCRSLYTAHADRIQSGQHASAANAWDQDDHPSSSFAEAAAGSLTARGFMWANAHPAPRSWFQMRGPAWKAANRARLSNTDALSRLAWQHG